MSLVTQAVRAAFDDGTIWHRSADVTGTPLVSAVRRFDGREVPDIYRGTISGKSGTTCNVTISCQYSRNSQHGLVIPATCDSATVNASLVRGWDVVLDSTLANGDVFDIYAGRWLGSLSAGNAAGNLIDDSDGYADPGPSSGHAAGSMHWTAKIAYENIFGELLTDMYAEVLTPVLYKPTAGAGLREIDNIADLTAKTLSLGSGGAIDPYLVTFANLNTVPTPDTIDVLFDSVSTYNWVRSSDGATGTGTTGLRRDGTEIYQLTEGPLSGLQFVISATAANSDTAEIYVFPKEWLEITPDVAGSPGARDVTDGSATWGTTPHVLTAGSGVARGEIAVGATAYGWAKLTVPATARWAANPNCKIVRVRGNIAGYTGL